MSRPLGRLHLAFGANLGAPEATFARALRRLGATQGITVERWSLLWESAAVGPEQPRYRNLVAELTCTLPPLALLDLTQSLEREAGRVPGERWGPRPLDLDLLLWGDQRLVLPTEGAPRLTVPHLELARRKFVLGPLSELVPDAVVPGTGARVVELLEQVEGQDARPFGPLNVPRGPSVGDDDPLASAPPSRGR